MKIRTALIHAGSLALFTAAVAGAAPRAQTDTPAEKQYKNIKVFTGSPAKDILPAMNAMTAALGVKCSFCHVQDDKGEAQFDKDTEHKDSAREMVTMMRKINTDNFQGNMEVTCATCHQGHSSPNRFAPIGQPPAPERPRAAAGATMPTADSLVEKYINAIGGAAAVGKIQTLDLKGDALFDTTPAKVEILAKSPGKVLNTMVFGPATYVRGYDGAVAWGKDAGNPAVADEPASEIAFDSPYSYLRPKDFYKSFQRVRKDTLNGSDVYVVGAQSQFDNIRQRLYFDANTGLLLRVWTATDTLVGAVPGTEDYGDYRDVNGVKVPFKVIDTTGEGTNTFTFTQVDANRTIDDSKFARPK